MTKLVAELEEEHASNWGHNIMSRAYLYLFDRHHYMCNRERFGSTIAPAVEDEISIRVRHKAGVVFMWTNGYTNVPMSAAHARELAGELVRNAELVEKKEGANGNNSNQHPVAK